MTAHFQILSNPSFISPEKRKKRSRLPARRNLLYVSDPTMGVTDAWRQCRNFENLLIE
jgi:hypothetical protein